MLVVVIESQPSILEQLYRIKLIMSKELKHRSVGQRLKWHPIFVFRRQDASVQRNASHRTVTFAWKVCMK